MSRMYIFSQGARHVRIYKDGHEQHDIDQLLGPCREKVPIDGLQEHGITAWADSNGRANGRRPNLNVKIKGRRVTLHGPVIFIKQDQWGKTSNLTKPDIQWLDQMMRPRIRRNPWDM